MSEKVKITIRVDSTAVSGLGDRIARLADVCTQEDADELSRLSEKLVAERALFEMEFVPGQNIAVMAVNADFLRALATVESSYGL